MFRDIYISNKVAYMQFQKKIDGGMLIIGPDKLALKYTVDKNHRLVYDEKVAKNFWKHKIGNDSDVEQYNKQHIENFLYFVLPYLKINGCYLSIDGIKNFLYISCGYNGIVFSTKTSDGSKIVIKIISDMIDHYPETTDSDIDGYKLITNKLITDDDGYVPPPSISHIYCAFYQKNKFVSFDDKITFHENVAALEQNTPFMDQHTYIVMEPIDGDLASLYTEFAKLKLTNYSEWIDILLNCLNDLLSALYFLQMEPRGEDSFDTTEYALCHLDIKPENIAFIKNHNKYTFKLIDYGSIRKYNYGKAIDTQFAGSPTYARFSTGNNCTIFRDYYCLLLAICEIFNVFDNVDVRDPANIAPILTKINDILANVDKKNIANYIPANDENPNKIKEVHHKIMMLYHSRTMAAIHESTNKCANFSDVKQYLINFNNSALFDADFGNDNVLLPKIV